MPENSSLAADPFDGEQTVLILVGLVGAGKSTFAEALERCFPKFRRCNQDSLGSRKQVEELAYRSLRQGLSPCIDRTNFNAIQRSYWTRIARALPGTSVSVIVFDIPYRVCASRLQHRTSHPTIKNAQEGLRILEKFASEFEPPSPDEGYDHIIHLSPSDHPSPEYSRAEISSILTRLRTSKGIGTGNGRPHRWAYSPARGYSVATRGHRDSVQDRGSWGQSGRFPRANKYADGSSSGRGGHDKRGTQPGFHEVRSRSPQLGRGDVPHRDGSTSCCQSGQTTSIITDENGINKGAEKGRSASDT